MPANRRAVARFTDVTPQRDDGSVGVALGFRPERARLDVDRIEAYAELGPALTVPAVAGLGKVLRILRAARVAAPEDPLELVGREGVATDLLERAVGTLLRLELQARFRKRFVAWTENGVETIDDVFEVREREDAYYVVRRGGRFPVRFERSGVVRQSTESERWYEVVDIQRP